MSKYAEFSNRILSGLNENDEITVHTLEFIRSLSYPYGQSLVQILNAWCETRGLKYILHGDNNKFLTFSK